MRSPFDPHAGRSRGLALLMLIVGLVLAVAPLAQATGQTRHSRRYVGADRGLDRLPATSRSVRDLVGARLPRRAGTDADCFGPSDDVRIRCGNGEWPMAFALLGQHSADASLSDGPSALTTSRSWPAIASRAPPTV